ncbi:hypothetical protein M3Y95_00966400 [Aphelenchoides besseyi]|nr:hypothetical protein M3Y95_00966400 [Aphelenchoides besseyi]
MFSTLFEYILCAITAVTVLLQFYVIFLVQNKSPRTMHEYRYFLNMFTIWDISFTVIMGFLFVPVPITPRVAATVRGFASYFGDVGARLTFAASMIAGSHVMLSQIHCLVYRFTSIQMDKKFHHMFMSLPSKTVLMVLNQLIALALGYGFYLTLMPVEEVKYRLANWTYDRSTVRDGDVAIFLDVDSTYTRRYFIVLVVLFVVAEIACIILIVLILRVLKRNSKLFSRVTLRLNLQFCRLLIIQMATPAIVICGPVFCCIIAIFAEVESNTLITEAALAMITMYGPLNSIFTIFFVSPYRQYTYKLFILPWLRPLLFGLGLQRLLTNKRITMNKPSVTQTTVRPRHPITPTPPLYKH